MEGYGRGQGGQRSRGRGGGDGGRGRGRGGGGRGGGWGRDNRGGQQQQQYYQQSQSPGGGGGRDGGSGDYSPDPYQTSTQPYQQGPYNGVGVGSSGRRGGGRGRGYGGDRDSSSSYHQQAPQEWGHRRGKQYALESGGSDGSSVRVLGSGETSARSGGYHTGGEGSSQRSSGGAWGKAYASVKTRLSPEPAAPEFVMSEMQASSRLAPPSNLGTMDTILPLKHPDVGGRNSSQICGLFVNHYHVKFNPDTIIMHYDVDIKRDQLSNRKVTKANLTSIRHKLPYDNAWPAVFLTAYYGEKNIYSAEPLPMGNFVVEVSEGEDTPTRSFVLTIKLVNELKL